jgi:hypothetical protein
MLINPPQKVHMEVVRSLFARPSPFWPFQAVLKLYMNPIDLSTPNAAFLFHSGKNWPFSVAFVSAR